MLPQLLSPPHQISLLLPDSFRFATASHRPRSLDDLASADLPPPHLPAGPCQKFDSIPTESSYDQSPYSPVASSESPSGSSVSQYDYNVQSDQQFSLSPSQSKRDIMYENDSSSYYNDPAEYSHLNPSDNRASSPGGYGTPSPLASASPPPYHQPPLSAPPNQPVFPDRFLPGPNPPPSSSLGPARYYMGRPSHGSSLPYPTPGLALDRRMSEPAINAAYANNYPPPHSMGLGSSGRYSSTTNYAPSPPTQSSRPPFNPSHRSAGSLGEFPLSAPNATGQHPPYHQPAPPSGWHPQAKQEEGENGSHPELFSLPTLPTLPGLSGVYGPSGGQGQDEPVSPLHSNFSGGSSGSGGAPSPQLAHPHHSSLSHHHPQPIELDSEPLHSPTQRHVRPARRLSVSSTTPTSPTTAKLSPLSSPTSPSRSSQKKQYSFIPLPGQVRKRPRRRYDEIERHYVCSWPGCTKAYGTLNHLNAHVVMQGHGQRRVPSEFKELRKQWRKQKKEEAVAAAAHQTSSVPDHAPSLSSAYPVPPLHHRVSLPSLPHTILQSHDSPMSGGYHHSHHHQIRTPQHANTFPPPSLSHHHHPHHQHSHPHPHSAYSLPMGPPPSSSSTGGGYNPYGGAVPGASSSVDELDLRYPSSSDMHHSSHHQQQQGGGRTPGSVSDRLHPAWGAESLSSGGLTGRFASVSGPGSSSGLGGNRLPPDSILSTPLPGYEPSTYEENGSGEEYDRY